ncbi:unnamed protein product [Rotaria sp. Silwood1]|nr:unnamed protein product [Rotaria sp. Silwood1]CAF4613592.1 unnamed protein product [Rotaria sp. Silwood1]
MEPIKRIKIENEHSSSSNDTSSSSLSSYLDFYKFNVNGKIYSFDIYDLLENNNYYNDNIINYVENYLNHFSSYSEISEEQIQSEFDNLIINLLQIFNHSTSLKYISTSKLCYLKEKYHPDCTFVYKNININIKTKHSCLQDFVICLGEVNSSQVSLTDKSVIGQTLQHLQMLLNLQQRERIYGFLTNFTHITFFYIEAEKFDHTINYYKSQDLEMFNYLPATSLSIDTITTTEQLRQAYVNKDTWNIFTKFLTMKANFYEYTQLNINPLDDLLSNRYNIRRKLGIGATAMVFLLEKNENNYSNDDFQHCVMKIFREHSYSKVLSNELKITQQLKQINNSNKFNLFFEDILYSSLTGKFLLFKNELQNIDSLSLNESKQLIDILHYLYDCNIIHRDIRRENLMFDSNNNHLKLIDFGFAITYQAEKTPIAGALTLASCEFLISVLQYPRRFSFLICYDYKQTFDLECALNLILYMNDFYVHQKIQSIHSLSPAIKKIDAALQFWEEIQRKYTTYSKILHKIKTLTDSSTFDVIKEELENLIDF